MIILILVILIIGIIIIIIIIIIISSSSSSSGSSNSGSSSRSRSRHRLEEYAISCRGVLRMVRKGDDAVGSPHRAQLSQFELFEFILLLELDKRFPVQQFEAAVSQSTLPSPHLNRVPTLH